MAKHPKKPGAIAAAPSRNISGAVGLGVRAILAVALILIAWRGFALNWNNLQAEMEAVKGRGLIDIEGQQLIAQEHMRRALRMAPYHPDFRVWFGASLLRIENQKVVAETLASFNVERLEEAYQLLEGAQTTYSFPGLVLVKAAEAANMLSTLMTREPYKNEAQHLAFAANSAGRYMEFRMLSGKMHFEPELFYPPAMYRSYDIRRHDWVLTFYDDYNLYWENKGKEDTALRATVNRSRRELGETPMMVADLAEQAVKNPNDGRVLGELIVAARDHGRHRDVMRFLDHLERNNLMSNELREYQHHLLELLNRDRVEKFSPQELEDMSHYLGGMNASSITIGD